jgi:hypothetical protein
MRAMAKQERIAEFLDQHIVWERDNSPYRSWGGKYPWLSTRPTRSERSSVEESAQEFLGLAEFLALQLGTWLGTTDGQMITQAVEAVSPPFYQEDVELLVAALKLAAATQQKEDEKVAGGFALAAIVGFALLFWATNNGKPGGAR